MTVAFDVDGATPTSWLCKPRWPDDNKSLSKIVFNWFASGRVAVHNQCVRVVQRWQHAPGAFSLNVWSWLLFLESIPYRSRQALCRASVIILSRRLPVPVPGSLPVEQSEVVVIWQRRHYFQLILKVWDRLERPFSPKNAPAGKSQFLS